MQSVLADVLERRRNRSIAIILGVKERECDSYLPEGARQALRKVVLDQLNEYHDFIMDVFRSVDTSDEVVLNEHYLEKLDAIHDMLFNKNRMIRTGE